MDDKNLLGLNVAELQDRTSGLLEPAFRARQLYAAIYRRKVLAFEEVTELPLEMRAALAESFELALPELVEEQRSEDETVKSLYRLHDGATIETVDIPGGARRTICVSSQAGCALACRFCVTGYWGAGRNLSAGEIVGQVLDVVARRPEPERTLRVVFMGMGEPLLNREAVVTAIGLLQEQVSWRRITVSTAGVVPEIAELAQLERPPRLALSLHAPSDELRSSLMPINRRYGLEVLFRALEQYPCSRRYPILFEYTLIRGVNDHAEHARQLATLSRRVPSKINLLPLNPDPVLGDLRPSEDSAVQAFRKELVDRGVRTSLRRPRGRDVGGACGQLRAFGREPRGFPDAPSL